MRAFALQKSYPAKETWVFLWAVLCAFLSVSSRAEQSSLIPLAPTGQEIKWVLGPAKAPLGKVAVLNVPEGYRFADAAGAKSLLMRMRNPVPDNLVGMLISDSGRWGAVLTYSDLGYFSGLDGSATIDSDAALKIMRERVKVQNEMRRRQGMPAVTTVDWAMKPEIDRSMDSLEFAVRIGAEVEKVVNLKAETVTETAINHTLRLFGRNGTLDANVLQTDQDALHNVALKELMKNVTWNEGQRYADYTAGDKLAKLKLQELIAGDAPSIADSRLVIAGICIGVVLLTGALVTAGVVIHRRRHRRVNKMSALINGTPLPNGSKVNGHAVNGNGNGHANGAAGLRRRKAFNYHKYYADMMRQVSSGPSYLEPVANGHHAPAPRTNGAAVDPSINQAIVRAHLDLIASQTNLIEEQKRLLQEQSKLIEEKSRLIKEKNQLLEKQTELFERDLL